MSYLNFESKYDKFPKTKIKNHIIKSKFFPHLFKRLCNFFIP